MISSKLTAQPWQFSKTAGSVSRDYGGKVKIDPFGNIIVCGTIVIDLSDQPEGVYLCSLINEKSEIATETMTLIKSK